MTGKVHQKVADFFHRMVKAGEFGIEIEVEGKQLSRGPFKEWNAKDDGSLRGPDNIEYVLKRPLPLDRALKSLDEIVKQNKELGAEYMWSHRCSTHVHVNCTDLDMVQMANFVVSLFIFEKLLVSWCGPWRTGNLFCLTSEDARALIREATDWFKEPNGGVRLGDGIRYSAINLASLPKFGSIELRSLYGTLDKDVLSHWLTALHNIKEFSKKFENPKDIIVAFSKDGPIAIAKDALKEEYGVFFNPKKDEEDLLASVRRAQIIAFATDWDKFCLEREKKVEEEVFDVEIQGGEAVRFGWQPAPAVPPRQPRQRRPVPMVPKPDMKNFKYAKNGAIPEKEFNAWAVAHLQQ